MQKNSFRWKIGGLAGNGIKAAGDIFAKTCTRGGLHIFDYLEFPSLIRGGHNTYQIRVEDRDVFSHDDRIDLLVALNDNAIRLHQNELDPGGGIMYDPRVITADVESLGAKGIKLFAIPLVELAKKYGEIVMQNTVSVGASFALVKYPFEILERVIHDAFAGKNDEVVTSNVLAAKAGYDFIEKEFSSVDFSHLLEPIGSSSTQLVVTGNDALALGAIQAGCKLYVAYPMSPSSSILHTMAQYGDQFGIVVKHAEDELSVANMAIGANYAGVRAMLGTSGGGFALMGEAVGLAGITETPLVMVDAQRPGPATGLPTWTAQSDLRFVLHAAQGEFPRFVIAPGDMEECFYTASEAFNLAEKYQTPVIILLDKYLSEGHKSVVPFDLSRVKIDRGQVAREKDLSGLSEYRRYAVTESGISPRAFPGTKGGLHIANSDEHDPYGYSEESSENSTEQMEKRLRKFDKAEVDIEQPKLTGTPNADVTLVGWGSTKGPIREAMQLLEGAGITANQLHIRFINPFPSKTVASVFRQAKKTVVIENNATGQLFGLIRERIGLEAHAKVLKFDGRPFHPREIKKSIEDILTHA
ncbi:MAG TPA: 2-oxoacid:acceptor oxidoreductase subunit alpha [Candidatus Kerfeldbacteria bacterium]|nr:2-oxoacid:acceptor oxidoreductase subunit alpha [Candidatus Kerfeldbacteria bacterium]